AGVTTGGTPSSNAWGGRGWSTSTSSAGISANAFVTFGFPVGAGQSVSLSSIDLNYRRNSSGPTNGLWQFQIDNGAWVNIGAFTNQFPSSNSNGAAMTQISLSGIGALQNLASGTTVKLRLVPYGASASTGSWYIDDRTGNDLILTGSSTQALAAPPQVV